MPAWTDTVQGLLLTGRLDDAADLLRSHLRNTPRDTEAMRQLARIHAHRNQPREALDLLCKAVRVTPQAPGLHYEIGVMSLAVNQWGDAVRHLRKHAKAHPTDPDGLYNLSWALRRHGKPAEAETTLRQALTLRREWPAAWFNLGNLLLEDLMRPADARFALTTAQAQAPGSPDILCNLGQACWRDGALAEAELHLRSALTTNPAHVNAAEALGNLLTSGGRAAEGEPWLRKATELVPTQPSHWLNLALNLRVQNRNNEAVSLLSTAISHTPDQPELWNALGAVLLRLNRLGDAEAALHRCIELQPGNAEAHNNLGNLASSRGDEANAMAAYAKARKLAPDDHRIHSNLLFYLTHRCAVDDPRLSQERARYARSQEAAPTVVLPPLDARPDRPLRVGYVSPDFCEHAVSFWFEPILEQHDRDKFEVHCYQCGPVTDHVTMRLRGLADDWHIISGLEADAAAALIARHDMDILIDLAGHSANNALPVFARKPARIQATMIGFPASTGLTRIDYRVSDIHSDPLSRSQHLHSEQLELLNLPPVFRPPMDAPEPKPLVAGERIRFGSFNKPQKLTDEVFESWAAILRLVPASDLLLVVPGGDDEGTRQQYRQRFNDLGIAAERISTAGMRPLGSFLDLLGDVHIALDSFPYGGGTTTLLCLWMGVPMVTRIGDSSAGSVAVGMLSTLGLNDFIGADTASYIAAAQAAAAAPDRLRSLRDKLRPMVARTIVREERAFVTELERAYQRWWEALLAKSV